MSDTFERAIIREHEVEQRSYEACRRHKGLLLEDAVPEDFARKLFNLGFRMGFRHPNGQRRDWHRSIKDSEENR